MKFVDRFPHCALQEGYHEVEGHPMLWLTRTFGRCASCLARTRFHFKSGIFYQRLAICSEECLEVFSNSSPLMYKNLCAENDYDPKNRRRSRGSR